MKISTKPTEYILVRADCQSEWGSCDRALISCDADWKKELRKKLEAIDAFDAPSSFISFKFQDAAIEFYSSKDDEIETLIDKKDWAFVTLEEREEDSLDKPESCLETGALILYKDGTGF